MTLSVVMTGDEPPTEFRLFTAGTVETKKGTFVFDEAAALSVMAEYEAHGIDLMVDYDHASLAGLSLDPALAGKAAGWFNLALRNGELWAVNVRWTEPAADALRAKEWRFMSPAFSTDGDRITSVLNVAITNLPATRRLEPLMAASVVALGEGMDPKLIQQALDAIAAGDEAAALDLLKSIVAAAAGTDPDAGTEDAPPPVGDGGADEMQEMAGAPPPAGDPKEDKPAEMAAALSAVASLSGKSSLVASVADIRAWHASHVTLAAERADLAKREALLEGAERRKLCVELVTLAGRAPSAVWADDKATTPKPYLLSMPIADLKAMCADEIKANAGRSVIKPPKAGGVGSPPAASGTDKVVATPHGDVTLSAREITECKRLSVDVDVYAANKALQQSAKRGSKE